MPRTKISEYSTTNSDNTDIEGINIAENCPPSGINNAIREVMVHLKEFQTGASGDPLTVAGAFVASSTASLNGTTIPASATLVKTSDKLSVMSATSSSELAGVISDETGTGALVFANSPTLVTPTLGAASATSVTVGAGTVSAPSITTTGDTNTGIYFPAADTIAFAEGGVEAMRINSSGQLNLANNPIFTGGTANGVLCLNASKVATSGSALTFDGTGLGVGTTALSGGKLSALVDLTAANGLVLRDSATTYANNNNYILLQNSVGATVGGLTHPASASLGIWGNDDIRFVTTSNATERARITSGGDFLVGTTSGTKSTFVKNNSGDGCFQVQNTASSNPIGLGILYPNADPNSSASAFLEAYGYAGGYNQRFAFYSNGGLANYSGNNVNLSDRREKTNFAPSKNYLDVICNIPVQTFNYIDQSEDDPGLTLGVVAQDVQAVAPELVMESNWGTEEEPKMRLSIYQTDLQYAMMKAIQELKAELDTVKAELNTLKGA